MKEPFAIGSKVWPGLSKLIEELGEVQQVVGKIIATGGAHRHWADGNLAERLEEEMGDLFAAIDFVISYNGLHRDVVQLDHVNKYESMKSEHDDNAGAQHYTLHKGSLWCGLGALTSQSGTAQLLLGHIILAGGVDTPEKAFHGRLERALGNLQAALNFVLDYNPVLRSSSIQMRITHKKGRFKHWHENPIPVPGEENV